MTSPSIASREVHNRLPVTPGSGIRRMTTSAAPSGRSTRSPAECRADVRSRRCRPEFDHPDVIVAGGGEMDRDGGRCDARRPRRAVSLSCSLPVGRRGEVLTEVGEPGVADAARSGDEQLDPVAGDAVCLRRFGGVGGGGAIEVGVRLACGHHPPEARGHACAPTAAGRWPGSGRPPAWCRAVAGTPARRTRGLRGRRCPRPGTRPDASRCACRLDRRRRPGQPGSQRQESRRAGRARPSTSRIRPSLRTASIAASDVRFTITPWCRAAPAALSGSGQVARRHSRRTRLASQRAGSRRASVAGWGRAGWRC